MAVTLADMLRSGMPTFLAFDFDIGENQFRIATQNVSSDSGPYKGLIVGTPTISRAIGDPGPILGDVSLTIDNTGGEFDDLLNEIDDRTKNLTRALISIWRGAFDGTTPLAKSLWNPRGKYQHAIIESMDPQTGHVTLRLTERRDTRWGLVKPPTYGNVDFFLEKENADSYSDNYPHYANRRSDICPIVLGSFHHQSQQPTRALTNDMMHAPLMHFGLFGPSAFSVSLSGRLHIAALTPFGFGERQQVRLEAGGKQFFEEAYGGTPVSRVTVYDLTVNHYNDLHALVLRTSTLSTGVDDALIPWFGDDVDIWTSVRTLEDASATHWSDMNPVEAMEAVLTRCAEMPKPLVAPWIDPTSWAAVKEIVAGIRVRYIIDREMPVMSILQDIARQAKIRMYFKGDGTLALFTLSPEGTVSSAYAGKRKLRRHKEIRNQIAVRKAEGSMHGLVTKVTVRFKRQINMALPSQVTIEDEQASMQHGRVAELEGGYDAKWIRDRDSAEELASRIVGVGVEWPWVLRQELGTEAAEIELGETVLVTDSGIPHGQGYIDRPAVIESIVESVDGLEVEAIAYGILNEKVYLLGDEGADALRFTPTSGETMSVTDGSNGLTAVGWDPVAEGLAEWDIMVCGTDVLGKTTNNNLICTIDSVTTSIVTLKDPGTLGAEYGNLPDATAAIAYTEFRVYKGHETLAASVDDLGRLCRDDESSPGARRGHSIFTMIDSSTDGVPTGKLILFGGYDGSSYLNDIWEWDEATRVWTELSPGGSGPPAGRAFHASWIDRVSGYMMVHGGKDGSGARSDTWAYDVTGNSWADVSPGGVAGTDYPEARYDMVCIATTDSGGASEDGLLFGGWDGSTTYNDTWRWGGSEAAWLELTPATVPTARYGHMGVTAAGTEQFFGGWDPSGGVALNDLYMWLSDDWVLRTVTTSPDARLWGTLVYGYFGERSGQRERLIVLFGGVDDPSNTAVAASLFNDTWILDTNAGSPDWEERTPTVAKPEARWGHAMAFDYASYACLMLGGQGPTMENSADDNIWEYDAQRGMWRLVEPQSTGKFSDGVVGYMRGIDG